MTLVRLGEIQEVCEIENLTLDYHCRNRSVRYREPGYVSETISVYPVSSEKNRRLKIAGNYFHTKR